MVIFNLLMSGNNIVDGVEYRQADPRRSVPELNKRYHWPSSIVLHRNGDVCMSWGDPTNNGGRYMGRIGRIGDRSEILTELAKCPRVVYTTTEVRDRFQASVQIATQTK